LCEKKTEKGWEGKGPVGWKKGKESEGREGRREKKGTHVYL